MDIIVARVSGVPPNDKGQKESKPGRKLTRIETLANRTGSTRGLLREMWDIFLLYLKIFVSTLFLATVALWFYAAFESARTRSVAASLVVAGIALLVAVSIGLLLRRAPKLVASGTYAEDSRNLIENLERLLVSLICVLVLMIEAFKLILTRKELKHPEVKSKVR